MKTPADKRIVFTFASHPMRDARQRWRAELEFPPGSTSETMLPIRMVDGEETPVAEGTFEFAGLLLPVRNGAASLTFAEFVAGKHSVPLWLHRPGLEPVPGGATFG